MKFKNVLLSLILVAASSVTQAQEEPYSLGAHYEILTEAQPVQTGDKIEVVELFWYKCPHCNKLEPYVARWLENIPANAEFIPVPAVLSNRWEFHARIYYTFEALGLAEQLHQSVFSAIHAEGKNLDSIEAVADWASKNGADRQSVIDTFSSFAVENKLSFSKLMSRRYGISGVPAIIVDGKYRTSVSMAGGEEELFNIINFLIEKAASNRDS